MVSDVRSREAQEIERQILLQRFVADLVQLRDTRAAGDLGAFNLLMLLHHQLLERYVDILRSVAQLPVLVIGRIETEPGPHSDRTKHRASPIDRWIRPGGPLGRLRFLVRPLSVPIQMAYHFANERGADRYVISLRPLVRIFVGIHIKRTVADLLKGYTYIAVSLDTTSPNTGTRPEWLKQVREELEKFSGLLPTWRSTATALLGIPLATTIPSLLYKGLGTEDLFGTIIKFAPQVLSTWQIWIPPALYFLTFVSWSYALKRRLFLGERTISRRKHKIRFSRTVYSLEARLFSELPTSRRKEKPLDLLLPSVLYIFAGVQSLWLPFSGIRNARGEPAPIANLFSGLILLSLGGGYLIALSRREHT
jgi:hypothetical protein